MPNVYEKVIDWIIEYKKDIAWNAECPIMQTKRALNIELIINLMKMIKKWWILLKEISLNNATDVNSGLMFSFIKFVLRVVNFNFIFIYMHIYL